MASSPGDDARSAVALTDALDALRAETLARVSALDHDLVRIVDASRDSNADDEHDPEGQTIAWDREQTAALLREARQRLDEIERARERVGSGWDGSCEVCGRPIDPERLLVRPTTTRCVGCASA